MEFLSPTDERPPGGRVFRVDAGDGTGLRVALWPLDGAKGTVLMFSGRTEYIEIYARHAKDLTQAGYAVATLDWRGQGLSDRDPRSPVFGYVDSFDDYQTDAGALVREAAAAGLPKPYFMLAHSMGGNIGLRYLLEGGDIRAAAFTSPMWALGSTAKLELLGASIAGVHLALGLGKQPMPGTGPNYYAINAPFEDNDLTTSEDEWNHLAHRLRENPEIGLGRATCAWVYRANRDCRMLQRATLPGIPTVVLTGGDERVVGPRGFSMIADRWPAARIEHFPAGRHELLIETPKMRARAFAIIIDHFDSHC